MFSGNNLHFHLELPNYSGDIDLYELDPSEEGDEVFILNGKRYKAEGSHSTINAIKKCIPDLNTKGLSDTELMTELQQLGATNCSIEPIYF